MSRETPSHKLKSPLASLKACLYLLRRSIINPSPDVSRYLDSLDLHANTLQERIEEVIKVLPKEK